ncbi:MAG: Nif3-like dinuclear metal center hexameric protein, partial [Promicromonosporaceae bacterium]|nr:Nif3-like dinuclear metal center hexameric protein [Promicromonosporaceae bacterium]
TEQEVSAALVALDVTPGVIEEAKELGAQLIVTHHPLLFSPRRDLREEDREGRLLAALIRAKLSLLAAHTNFDKAPGGVNDALLAALGLAEKPPGEPLDPETAAYLLCSPLGGLDALDLRRLRRALRTAELTAGGGRASDGMLGEVLASPAAAEVLPVAHRRGPLRVAAVLAAGSAAARHPEANPQTVLWAIWSAAGLAETWRDLALAGGPAGARADRDLDAVMTLFKQAERFVERLPGATIAQLVDYLAEQDHAADSLAASAQGIASVEALTPAGAAGREWEFVVVTGVQDGVWPDLRLRDSLLGSQALVEVLEGRAAGSDGTQEARRQVLADELRAFLVATTRARRRLLVTAVKDAETEPSVFCDLIAANTAADDQPDSRLVAPPTPFDLRGVVAEARRRLLHGDAAAAGLLALLTEHAVAGANPDAWYGARPPSSDSPLWGPSQQVPVSPSRVEQVTRCPLRWSFEAAGGTAAGSSAQHLGTLIHAIAQRLPTGTLAQLRAELDRQWPGLGLPAGWSAAQERRRAEAMIERLAQYLADSGPVLAVEARFGLEVGRARLSGSIDRVEEASPGVVSVADFKTGSHKPSVLEAQTNPQMGAYQLAVQAGAVVGNVGPFEEAVVPDRTAEARLVFLADGAKGPTLRRQAALVTEADGSNWASEQVQAAADTMSAPAFEARVSTDCARCPVASSCPADAAGRQVIA